MLTGRDNTLYVHLVNDPTMSRVLIPPIDRLPAKATLLNTGQSLPVYNDPLPTLHMGHDGTLRTDAKKDFLRVAGPASQRNGREIMVLKLEFDG